MAAALLLVRMCLASGDDSSVVTSAVSRDVSSARCPQAAAASAAEHQQALASSLAQLKGSLSAKVQELEADLEARGKHTEAVSRQVLDLRSEVVSAQRAAEDARRDASAADERVKVSGGSGGPTGLSQT